MKSQFFITPTIETVIKESVDIINVGRPMNCYDIEDIRAIAKEADNIILLEGHAKGSYRVSDAIEDAIIKICDVAKEFDFFSANKIFVHLCCGENHPISVSEVSELEQLAGMFMEDIVFMWGLSIDDNTIDDTVIVKIIAANLKLKQ